MAQFGLPRDGQRGQGERTERAAINKRVMQEANWELGCQAAERHGIPQSGGNISLQSAIGTRSLLYLLVALASIWRESSACRSLGAASLGVSYGKIVWHVSHGSV